VSPANAVLFNLLCYVGVAAIIVAACPRRPVCTVALGAITIDPAFVVFGTQALKDPFCILLIALAASGVRVWSDGINPGRFRAPQLAFGLIATSVGVFGIAGVRAYVAVFVMVGVVAAALVTMFVSGRT